MSIKQRKASLRDKYVIIYELGLICSLLVMIGAVHLDVKTDTIIPKEPPSSEAPYIDIPETVKPETPKPPKPRVAIPKPVDNEVEGDFDFDFPEFDDNYIELPTTPPSPDNVKQEEEFILSGLLEKEPSLIGGTQALYKHITYPELAKKIGTEGTVIIQFILDERGNVLNPIILRGIGSGCDEEALKAIKKVTFTPGQQNGRNVKVKMTQTVIFRLKN